ncbi:MAG: VWA domain-containing protein [Phycisphaerae bacterium]|jgi:hypothetical protein|nr:VWA domain-containing protein [Phycisphaerae bacterium]
MGQKADSTPTQGNASLRAISDYRHKERLRWKKRVLSFIFAGILISLLVHFNIAVLLNLLLRGGSDGSPEGAMTTIEFAMQDASSLSDMPEGQKLTQQESVQTEASSDVLTSTEATLEADPSTTSLNAKSSSMSPSLAGGGTTGMGGGMGGSGGGTSFFGISSSGTRFCYIVDASGSMSGQNRMAAAIAELTRSLKRLPDFARFYVLFYSSNVLPNIPSTQKGWNTARSSTIRRMTKEFESIRPGGGTNPGPAFAKALSLRPLPEVIFFLTDGVIAPFSAEKLREMMPDGSRIVVNTIAFGVSANQEEMISIAKSNRGQYRFVKSEGTKP